MTALAVTGCSLVNITSGSAGSFLSSITPGMAFDITDCIIDCTSTFTKTLIVSQLNLNSANTGSLFNIANAAMITSANNLFKNCYTATSGSIFALVNSNLIDTNSTFE